MNERLNIILTLIRNARITNSGIIDTGIVISDSFSTTGFNIVNFDLADCCVYVLPISNYTYTAPKVEAAKTNIIAGENIGMGTTVGPVVVEPGVKVRYISKKVDLMPGFKVKPGSDFKIILTDDCTYQSYRFGMQQKRNDFVYNRNLTELDNQYDLQSSLTVFPNPSNDIFYFKSSSDNIVSVQIFNNMGQLIASGAKNIDKYVVNLKSFQNGTFVYRIQMIDASITYGKLIKVDGEEY